MLSKNCVTRNLKWNTSNPAVKFVLTQNQITILKQNQWKACGVTVRQTCWVSVTSNLCDWLTPVIEALTSDSDVWASADLRFPLRPCEGDKHSQILLLPQTHHSEHTSLLLPQISVSEKRDLSERRSRVFKHICFQISSKRQINTIFQTSYFEGKWRNCC